jgi:hypothetical protein
MGNRGILERAMGIEPRHDSRYVAETIGYPCHLPDRRGQFAEELREALEVGGVEGHRM